MSPEMSPPRSVNPDTRGPRVQGVASTMLWAILAVSMLSLFGLELIPQHQGGLWVVFTALVFLGALLTVRAALFVGVCGFLAALVWVLWRVNVDNLYMADLLFMFLLPLACIPLSAMRKSIDSRRRLDRRVTNWRMMPIHQLSGVLSYLRNNASCQYVLTVELLTSNLGFQRSLLGVEDGRLRLNSLQEVLVKTIGEDGWAFLDYDNARCRVLLPGMSDEQFAQRFATAVADVRNISVRAQSLRQVPVTNLLSINAVDAWSAAAVGAS